jgi:hypothetical protein
MRGGGEGVAGRRTGAAAIDKTIHVRGWLLQDLAAARGEQKVSHHRLQVPDGDLGPCVQGVIALDAVPQAGQHDAARAAK